MQTIIEAIRLWKTHGGLWQECVSKRHGAQTEHFVEECQSNRMKENDEAMSKYYAQLTLTKAEENDAQLQKQD